MEPIRFESVLKTTLWGGDKIIPFKHLDSHQEQVGESWEISGVKDNETRVANGEYAGKTINKLVSELKSDLVGKANYQRFGDEFPLLIKYIDARQDLSIQVHPDDETARKQGKARGKTEMWYIIENAPGAKLYSGLKQKISPEEYKQMVENDTICDALAQYEVCEDDVFFLPAGRIHAIGAGCFLAEIQQTSDVTYRIYDFKRKDKDGNYRELHTQQAAESIDYNVCDDYRTHYTPEKNKPVTIVSCPYFTTDICDVDQPTTISYEGLESFVILIPLKGEATLVDNENNQATITQGETILIPATTKTLQIKGKIKFLQTYIVG